MNLRKSVLFALTLGFSGFYALPVLAGTATCDPRSGSATAYENSILRDLSSSENARGSIINEAMNSSQQSYQISCNCSAADASSANGVLIMYTLQTTLPLGHTTNYFKINDHLDVTTQVAIPKNGNVTVPTSKAVSDGTHHWDKENTGICAQQSTQDNLITGSQGNIDLYITTPFIGELTIPRTEIARVYASSATVTTTAPPLGSPVAILYLSGTITVPQNCEINQGEIISVRFGTIQASRFTKINTPPDGYRPIAFDIKYDCTKNGLPVIPNNDKLEMILEGQDVENQYYLIARRRPSDNKADIGIVVQDAGGTYMPFAQGVLPMNQNGLGKVTLTAFPINLVGGELDTGEFEATATLKVDIR
ncbi:fimbrial protein [Rahnella sikkimica]|uniref:Fimbrial protein n=1 Tax=Rahnella sikkimica TaxID=1805933 RepID=A0A2L1UTL4_9GAMM|nr:fimbrial protein [Rahnella sikkimica]AVF36237.1 fimbrial protein [Rahnella sikkimica]